MEQRKKRQQGKKGDWKIDKWRRDKKTKERKKKDGDKIKGRVKISNDFFLKALSIHVSSINYSHAFAQKNMVERVHPCYKIEAGL